MGFPNAPRGPTSRRVQPPGEYDRRHRQGSCVSLRDERCRLLLNNFVPCWHIQTILNVQRIGHDAYSFRLIQPIVDILRASAAFCHDHEWTKANIHHMRTWGWRRGREREREREWGNEERKYTIQYIRRGRFVWCGPSFRRQSSDAANPRISTYPSADLLIDVQASGVCQLPARTARSSYIHSKLAIWAEILLFYGRPLIDIIRIYTA